MEISNDREKPWWVVKYIGERTVFFAGCDSQEDANVICADTEKNIPEDRKKEIKVGVVQKDESLLS